MHSIFYAFPERLHMTALERIGLHMLSQHTMMTHEHDSHVRLHMQAAVLMQ